MNHNAEEIKTSAVVQCLFRLTAAPFLIKMGLGRPFRASPLFILHCPHPSHLHPPAEAPSFALSHGHSDTPRLAEETHRHHCSVTHTQLHTQPPTPTHSSTEASRHVRTQPHPYAQAHMEESHTLMAPVSLSHTLNYNLSQT